MREAHVRRLTTQAASCVALALALAVPAGLMAQAPPGAPGGQRGAGPGAGAPGQGRGGPPGAGRGAGGAGGRAAAPVDLTGYWVSLVTEDWIERMSPDSPPSGTGGAGGGFGGGGFGGGGGGRAGGGGAPAAGNADPCRVYGAGGSMRLPGRLNITWADDNTLKVDLDSGKQTRTFHFGAPMPANTPRSLQGYSVASWEGAGRGGGGGFGGGPPGGGRGGPAAPRWGSLKVVTTNMTGGYLLSSRNTYSENATLTENFSRHSDFGVEYLTVTVVIEEQGGQQRITSSTFKKEPDGSKFAPTGCDIVK